MSDSQLVESDAFHSVMELAWKVSFLSLMRPVVTDELVGSGTYSFSEKLPGFVLKNWSIIREFTIIDPFRLGSLLDRLHAASVLEGAIVECGSYRGGSAILMALALKSMGIKKEIHIFDSFEGLPEPHDQKDKGYKRGQFKADYAACVAKVNELGLADTINVHKGWFDDTITRFLDSRSVEIALLHIDCDLYASTRDCFSRLYPCVCNSGVVVLDDFNDGGRGEKIATLELMTGRPELMQIGPAPQCFFVKSGATSGGGVIIQDGWFKYSFDELFRNTEYISWLNDLMQDDYKALVAQFQAASLDSPCN
jgi:hypothetical protein